MSRISTGAYACFFGGNTTAGNDHASWINATGAPADITVRFNHNLGARWVDSDPAWTAVDSLEVCVASLFGYIAAGASGGWRVTHIDENSVNITMYQVGANSRVDGIVHMRRTHSVIR